MILKTLNLKNFRSYKSNLFEFDRNLTLVVGPNTSGKTNLLESIFALSVGESFRADKDFQMITIGEDHARISSQVADDTALKKLEIIITQPKKYLINGVSKRKSDFVGELTVCLFWPADLTLVTATPSVRREYLDYVLSQTSWQYRVNLQNYHKGLRLRNKILERIREGLAKSVELEYFNELLITNGQLISQTREEFISFINAYKENMDGNTFKLVYDLSPISSERLANYERSEILSATTLVGPHRDDFNFRQNDQDLADYGSRGEQRLGILWLKLGELAFLKQKKGDNPILLLDDIFSELDHHNRSRVISHIGLQQTIITTTDIHLIDKKLQNQAKLITL